MPLRRSTQRGRMNFRTLLYRYFFYGWLFRDCLSGTAWERVNAWRHNRQQARWLPTYLRRWSVLALASFGAAWASEVAVTGPLLSAALYVPSVVTVPFLSVTAVAWLFLTQPR
jgi:hypothetical protein